ncbi:hypothetical protein H6768_07140 [Candidatus Peribacteria bacterium]|nr:hypothetical protein [Candidatus Peribacteria bacterium]
MDNRFRREKNLSHSSTKKIEKTQHVKEDKIKDKTETSFVSYFLNSYKKIREYHVLRDTVLLAFVLFCFLFFVSWSLPKVFSFHFDPKSILSIFNSAPSALTGEGLEDTGDIDILIL